MPTPFLAALSVAALLGLAGAPARSAPAADAHVATAEAHFKAGRMAEALRAYEAAEKAPGATTLGYAVYKQGWCLLNLGRPEEALAAFERVLRLVADGKVEGPQSGTLAREAAKDLAKAYALARPPEQAAAYFGRVRPAEVVPLLERLGQLYFERGDARASAAIFRELIARQSSSDRICTWQARVVRAVMASGRKPDQVAEVQRLGAVLARLEGMPGASPSAVAACRKEVHDKTRELALLWHKEGQRAGDTATLGLAEPIYREHLRRFGQAPDSYDVAFFHAEVLWKLERWEEAAQAYTAVVERNPAGKHLKDAAYAAILAWKNAAGVSDEARGPGDGGVRARGISPAKQRLVEAMDRYLRHLPDASEAPAIRFRKARLFYDHDLHEQAAPLFLEVVEKHPSHEIAIYAASLHLDALHVLGRRKEVCAAAARFASGPVAARDAELGRQMKKLTDDCARAARR